MKALILADRSGIGLAPFHERSSVALLPVACKPVLRHTLEALAAAGIREAAIVLGPFAADIEEEFGDGTWIGMKIRYALARDGDAPKAHLERLRGWLGEQFLLVRGDTLHCGIIQPLLDEAKQRPPQTLHATTNDEPSPVLVVHTPQGQEMPNVPGDPDTDTAWQICGEGLEVGGGRVELLRSLPEFHEANMAAARGEMPELIIPGLVHEPGVWVGRQTRVEASSLRGAPILIGDRCDVRPTVDIGDCVVLSSDTVIDRRAILRNSVVLPETYVGEHLEVSNSIVWGDTLVRVDTGVAVQIPDPFLISHLSESRQTKWLGDLAHRAGGGVLLALSLPLWPVATVSALLTSRRIFETPQASGNQRNIEEGNLASRRTFTDRQFASSRPMFRFLPRLVAVVAGHLRLAGVSPTELEGDGELGLASDWRKLRESAPRGLFGPRQLEVSAGGSVDEALLADSFYAATRRGSTDMSWLIRGLRAGFTGRAWKRE
jgi:mannose-1-phosphate guanylyltransferase/phosphomannomutase